MREMERRKEMQSHILFGYNGEHMVKQSKREMQSHLLYFWVTYPIFFLYFPTQPNITYSFSFYFTFPFHFPRQIFNQTQP